jgi:hypothetical protein
MVLAIAVGAAQIWEKFQRRPLGGAPRVMLDAVAPLRAVNPYGVFANIVTERLEIVVEGTSDGAQWREYEFQYKPGEVTRAPRWLIPHQPRLDWQMWFAALGGPRDSPWFARFLARLLENAPSVTALLADNPFQKVPPIAVRANLYRYRFSTAPDRQGGIWWERELVGVFYPPVAKAQLEGGSHTPGVWQPPTLIDSLIRRR